MAAITKYNKFVKNQNDGTAVIDWNTDTIKVALVTNTYVPAPTTHDFFDDITNEVSGTNYTAGGATLGSMTAVESAGTLTVDGADVTWTQSASGFTTARFAIIYKSTGTASTSPLFGYIDFGADKGNVAGSLILSWNAAGIFTVN